MKELTDDEALLIAQEWSRHQFDIEQRELSGEYNCDDCEMFPLKSQADTDHKSASA